MDHLQGPGPRARVQGPPHHQALPCFGTKFEFVRIYEFDWIKCRKRCSLVLDIPVPFSSLGEQTPLPPSLLRQGTPRTPVKFVSPLSNQDTHIKAHRQGEEVCFCTMDNLVNSSAALGLHVHWRRARSEPAACHNQGVQGNRRQREVGARSSASLVSSNCQA